LGDGYAADEFRRHLRAKTTPTQWAGFSDAWRDYVQRLQGSGPDGSGAGAADAGGSAFSGDLADDVVASMNRDQRQQLAALRRAAEELARGGGDDDDGGARRP